MDLSSAERDTLMEHYQGLLRSCVGGQDWIVFSGILVGAVGTAQELRACGANRVLAIGAKRGTGTIAEDENIETMVLGLKADTMMGSIHKAQRVFADLPQTFRDRIDRWDPDRGARVLGDIFDPDTDIADRKVFGGRHQDWIRLEDKLIAPSLFSGAGIAHAPSRNVPVGSCEAAARGLDRGLGTVWAGDNRDGWHGGATLTRWVRNRDEAKAVARFLGEHCDSARVMPFLDGIPCSIHGIVFPEATIALRPCEMIVYRTPGEQGFVYCSAATLWDPPDADREVMRMAAKQMGDHLRHRVAFQGPFTLDGVMTAEGFLPTEVNTRAGAGLSRISASLKDLHLLLLCRAVAGRLDLDWRHEELEELLLDAADKHRIVGGHYLNTSCAPPDTSTTRPIGRVPGGYAFLPEGTEEPDGTLKHGPGAAGAFVMVQLKADRLPTGNSAAPYVQDALLLADQTWDLDLPPIEPAPDLRR